MRSENTDVAVLEWWADATSGWTLRGEAGVAGRLAPSPRGWLAETPREAWSIQRVGFHRPRVVVRPVGGLAEVAHAETDWRGLHALHFVSGPTWEIDPSHSGGTVVRDETRSVVFRIAWNGRFDLPGARVQADPARADGRFGPLAGMVAAYLVLESLGDPARRLAFGVPLGATARTRWS